ncbi:MAG: response regulator [Butyrivibrio sp.]|nr:response regulator [Butyrivibrio sp.]
MLKETLAARNKNEDQYFRRCEDEIIASNLRIQKQMSIILMGVYLAMLILANIIIKGFRIHPLYYSIFGVLILFFVETQIVTGKKNIPTRILKRQGIFFYMVLYVFLILIDVIPYKRDIAELFPLFITMISMIFIAKLKEYFAIDFALLVFFVVIDFVWKEPYYFRQDLFLVLACLMVSVICATTISTLRVNASLSRCNLEELSKAAAEAEAKAIAANGAKTQFLSQMSHEIRTPINAILGMNELIIREYSDDNLVKYAHNIKSAGNTLLSLINDVLDFSKVEAGKMELYCVEYDLSTLISELISMVDERARNKGLELKVTVNKDMPHMLFGDNVRLKQIILNILTNAVKYTEHGSVHMDFDYTSSAHLDLNGSIGLKVSVSDTGIGIREEDMARLFSPFERIEETRNRNVEGSGLGMSIVQKLLALMNSELHVRSEYGKGSTFSFVVNQEIRSWEPIGDFNATYNDILKSESEYMQLFVAPDAKILVVDDTEMNLVVVKNLLKDTKINVDTAISGKEALEKTSKEEYDLLFIDHKMPEMDGMELLWRLRSDHENVNSEKPCIALTANVFSGARETYKNSGFADYLSKPIIGDSLEKILLHYLPEDKIRHLDEQIITRQKATKVVKYEDKIREIQKIEEHIEDVREDYYEDEELYKAIGMLMDRSNISK